MATQVARYFPSHRSTFVESADVDTGSATFSGDGSTTTFTVSHGLGSVPSVAFAEPTSAAAGANHHVQNKTSTGFDVVFATAPASGTDNVTFDYEVRA